MRKERGNIILTALFVAVFLFFLSIALIWTNRQDITLSLAMEHKMKAEVAARSAAMKTYASLRSFDKTPTELEGELASGATWRVEVVELPPEGLRGKVLLVRGRGTSGPLSSYYTLHLLKSELGSKLDAGPQRMLGFVKTTPALAAGTTETTPEVDITADNSGSADMEDHSSAYGSGSTTPGSGIAVYGDFETKDLNIDIKDTEKVAAAQGPLFMTSLIESKGSPLRVNAYIPVLSGLGGATRAYGPVLLDSPALREENVLSVMSYSGEAFTWSPIPDPVDLELAATLDPPPISSLVLEAPPNANWTTISVRSIEENGRSFTWQDTLPATSADEEGTDFSIGATFVVDLSRVIEWGLAKSTKPKRAYSLRGAIAAYGGDVYSQGYEYLYHHYSGAPVASPVPKITGSTVTRWPCVRKYSTVSKQWSTVWSPLKDSGDVWSTNKPSPNILLVTSKGLCYSETLSPPRRLLRLEPNGNTTVGAPISSGTPFLYKDQPYTISTESGKPGMKNLETGDVIGFPGLLDSIPEITGPVMVDIEGDAAGAQDTSLETSDLETSPLEDEVAARPQMRTVRNEYNLSYALDPASTVACDGDDLYANLIITVRKEEPTYDFFGSFALGSPPAKVLARFDGERWHILPNGLMAALTKGLASPGDTMFCARYAGLPEARSRYTVVATSTDPFEFRK